MKFKNLVKDTNMAIPKRYLRFQNEFPEVATAYEQMGDAVHKSGPLDDKTRALIKLAISTGARMEGAVHSHARKAFKTGCTSEEMRHAVMLALPTIGLPSTMAALSWVDDILDDKKS
ncbi:MAG: carboxymuconolactone decarboxylase family protein [Candidatus Kapabacteria bacterium]|nr:carboxymuconolactone decarboxylase family protein [Candidatus Kapabacteria bacterium]